MDEDRRVEYTETALSHSPIIRIVEIKSLDALDPGFLHTGIDAERITRKDDKVGILALLQRTGYVQGQCPAYRRVPC